MLKGRSAHPPRAANNVNSLEHGQDKNKEVSRAEIKTTAMVLSFGLISIFKNIPILVVMTW